MKKIITSLFILFFSMSASFANEEVFLDVSNINTLKTPKHFAEMGPVDYEGNLAEDSRIDYYESRDKDETVFESKAGQAFEKFLNRAVVDKKPEDLLNNNFRMQNHLNQY